MSRRVSVIVAVVAVLAASVTTAVAVTVTLDDGDGWGSRGAMMPGMMHRMQVRSEYDYLAEMVAHHEEAVVAAQQLQRSGRAQMREFGDSIVASQSRQIDRMRRWLVLWYPNRSGEAQYQPMMRDLTGLSGDRLDRTFLQDMIGHHMGAVMMSQQVLMRGVAEHPQVEGLAATIRDEQHAEIFRMQRWLRAWFGARHRAAEGGPGRDVCRAEEVEH